MTRKQKLFEAIAISKQVRRDLERVMALKFGRSLADEIAPTHKLALEWVDGLQAILILTLDRENQRGDK